jgi:hypothetical protein
MAFIYQMITVIAFENTVFSLIPKENATVSISVLKWRRSVNFWISENTAFKFY